MSFLSGVSSVATIAANVTGGVINLGKGIFGAVGKISKSLVGKFAIGAAVAGILASDPTGKNDSFLSKAASGFKSFIGGIGNSVKSYASSAVSSAALGTAALATKVGGATTKAADTLKVDEVNGTGLRSAVIDCEPIPIAETNAGVTTSVVTPVTSHDEKADVQAEVC